jgi:hypothetical protein
VRVKLCVWICLVMFGALSSAEQRGGSEQFVGTWAGTWDGAGSGGFELTLEKADGGATAGRVSVTGEPTYKATIKTVTFDGATMKGKYDFPPDERAEVVIAVTFEAKTAKGTWTVVEKASSAEVAKGTMSLTKK